MKKTTYQIPEIRDEKDNIIQSGTYGKNSPLCNETNDGVLDYINNNLEYLKSTQDSIQNNYFSKSGGKITGDTEIEGNTVGQCNIPLKIQVPDLNDGEGVYLNLGKEGSMYNRFSFGFEYKSSGNTANAFSIGAYSGPHYTFDAVGNANFPKSLTAPIINASTLNISEGAYVPTANADNNSKTVANTAFVQTAIANLVGSAPATLNTLQELSTALGNDANFSATVAKQIGEKVSKAGDTITGPILYSKTPNDDSELPNKAYVDGAIKSAVNAAVASVTKTLSDNMHFQYPVGSYIYSDKADNPATYLPYMSDTTWEQTAAGRVLIGAGTADSGTVYTAGDKGGEEKHKLSVDELAKTTTQVRYSTGDPATISCTGTGVKVLNVSSFEWSKNSFGGNLNVSFGGDKPHNNMQPYHVIFIFKRTA